MNRNDLIKVFEAYNKKLSETQNGSYGKLCYHEQIADFILANLKPDIECSESDFSRDAERFSLRVNAGKQLKVFVIEVDQ